MLRGAIMIVMALDHVRDFVHASSIDPVDMQHTWPALFFTRWITHFCAPLFMFLAGTGAFLSLARGRSRKELAHFLITRGLFLIVVENTVMRMGWMFRLYFLPIRASILWALGWSMIALAGMIFLRRAWLLAISAAMILLHNAFDAVQAEAWGRFRWLWGILHEPGNYLYTARHVAILSVLYPLIPWIGVMGLGFAFGAILRMEMTRRRRVLYVLGTTLIVCFAVLRWTNVYGDPHPWAHFPGFAMTLVSFLNCQKYPPSLLYLLMTIGPGILALPVLEKAGGRVSRWVVLYGRVPMFYYILHIYVAHAIACGVALVAERSIPWVPVTAMKFVPPNWGFSLWVVYLVWMATFVSLYPLCLWYAQLKRRRNDWWLSYI